MNLAEKALEEELVRLEEGPLSEDFSGFINGAVLAAEIIAAAGQPCPQSGAQERRLC